MHLIVDTKSALVELEDEIPQQFDMEPTEILGSVVLIARQGNGETNHVIGLEALRPHADRQVLRRIGKDESVVETIGGLPDHETGFDAFQMGGHVDLDQSLHQDAG